MIVARGATTTAPYRDPGRGYYEPDRRAPGDGYEQKHFGDGR